MPVAGICPVPHESMSLQSVRVSFNIALSSICRTSLQIFHLNFYSLFSYIPCLLHA
jgi:hypothetical protein